MKVCQLLAVGRSFPLDVPVSSTIETDISSLLRRYAPINQTKPMSTPLASRLLSVAQGMSKVVGVLDSVRNAQTDPQVFFIKKMKKKSDPTNLGLPFYPIISPL